VIALDWPLAGWNHETLISLIVTVASCWYVVV